MLARQQIGGSGFGYHRQKIDRQDKNVGGRYCASCRIHIVLFWIVEDRHITSIPYIIRLFADLICISEKIRVPPANRSNSMRQRLVIPNICQCPLLANSGLFRGVPFMSAFHPKADIIRPSIRQFGLVYGARSSMTNTRSTSPSSNSITRGLTAAANRPARR